MNCPFFATLSRLAGVAFIGSVLSSCAFQAPTGPGLTPTAHSDFAHDTLALTWQPGFCASGTGCLPDQPHQPLIGLHGLWASEPHDLETQHVAVQEWWAKGCDLYDTEDTSPEIQPATLSALDVVMPHLRNPLYVHEYTKHARCFGYPADSFFVTSMDLRNRLASSAFGLWLMRQAGFQVEKTEVLAMFTQLTGATAPRSLQLRCEKTSSGQNVLSQMWFTLAPSKLSAFPAKESYLPSPDDQDGCPAWFTIPDWHLQ